MEYNEILKEIIMQRQNMFIYGDVKERKAYLTNLAKNYKLDGNAEQPIIIYTEYSGLPDCESTLCQETSAIALQRDHFEIMLFSLILEKLIVNLKSKELEILEKNLPFWLEYDFTSLENAKKILQNCQIISKELYLDYIKNGQINQKLVKEMEIDHILLQFILPEIKEYLPNISYFSIIINKTRSFGSAYRQIINDYMDEREHNILNIKIGCENLQDWGESRTMSGRFIVQTHSYGYVTMDDYKLNKTKKEQ